MEEDPYRHLTHDDFLSENDTWAIADKDEVVEMHPFGPRRVKKLPDNVIPFPTRIEPDDISA